MISIDLNCPPVPPKCGVEDPELGEIGLKLEIRELVELTNCDPQFVLANKVPGNWYESFNWLVVPENLAWNFTC